VKRLLSGNEAVARERGRRALRSPRPIPAPPAPRSWRTWPVTPTSMRVVAQREGSRGRGGGGRLCRAAGAGDHETCGRQRGRRFRFLCVDDRHGGRPGDRDRRRPGDALVTDEQDNRRYSKFARIPCLEPSDSQEAKEMVGVAFEISEQFDTPVSCG